MELNSENLEKYAHRMKEELDLKGVVVTLGKEEVFIQNPGQKYKIFPTRAKEVYDVSGAGDTFTAIFSMVSSLEDNWFIASDIVNHGSGIVVGEVGTSYVDKVGLIKSIQDRNKSIRD